METKTKKKLWKLLRFFMLSLLTLSNAVIFGFIGLDFLLALGPWFALGAVGYVFFLACEGEMLYQDLKKAVTKLITYDYYEKRIAAEYLRDNLAANLQADDCPAFFREYAKLLQKVHKHGYKADKKKLKEQEQWFTRQLFNKKPLAKDALTYKTELRLWLEQHAMEEAKSALNKRRKQFRLVLTFSLIAGSLMLPGMMYLLIESVAVLPFMVAFMATPGVMLPLVCGAAVLVFFASVAYVIMIYNCLTDMINNDVLKKWYQKLVKAWKEGFSFRNVCLGLISIILLGFSIFLTVTTAGTWWTLAKNTKPFCVWMTGIGKDVFFVLMGIIQSAFAGLTGFMSNLEQSSEAFDIIEKLTEPSEEESEDFAVQLRQAGIKFQTFWARLQTQENIIQIFNPLRVLVIIAILLLRILSFIFSFITATMDEDAPGFIETLMDCITEGFALGDLLIEEKSTASMDDMLADHFEDKDPDFPMIMLAIISIPAMLWDWFFSQFNSRSYDPAQPQPLGVTDVVKKYLGIQEEESEDLSLEDGQVLSAWDMEYIDHRIEGQKAVLEQSIVNEDIASEKCSALADFQSELRERLSTPSIKPMLKNEVLERLQTLENNQVLSRARHALFTGKRTGTQSFVNELTERVACMA